MLLFFWNIDEYSICSRFRIYCTKEKQNGTQKINKIWYKLRCIYNFLIEKNKSTSKQNWKCTGENNDGATAVEIQLIVSRHCSSSDSNIFPNFGHKHAAFFRRAQVQLEKCHSTRQHHYDIYCTRPTYKTIMYTLLLFAAYRQW